MFRFLYVFLFVPFLYIIIIGIYFVLLQFWMAYICSYDAKLGIRHDSSLRKTFRKRGRITMIFGGILYLNA